MQKRKTFTLSQAMQIYTGKSLVRTVIFYTVKGIIGYFFVILVLLLLDVISGNFYVYGEFFNESVSNILLGVELSVMLFMFQRTYEKEDSGGKFFRSVTGGFSTYQKMKTGILFSEILIIALVSGIFFAASAIFPFMPGTGACLTICVIHLFDVGVMNFISIIPKREIKYFLWMIFPVLLDAGSVVLIAIAEEKIGLFQMITAIFAIILIPLSQKIMLNHYQKNYWNT